MSHNRVPRQARQPQAAGSPDRAPSRLRRLALLAAMVAAAGCGDPLHAQQAPVEGVQEVQLQGSYLASLREQLRLAARYPTGREVSLQHPQGEVTLRFALARDGRVSSVQVVKSSESMLLDGAALTAVRRADYPVFLPELYPGQSSHDFQVTMVYSPAGQQGGAPAPLYVQASVQAVERTARP